MRSALARTPQGTASRGRDNRESSIRGSSSTRSLEARSSLHRHDRGTPHRGREGDEPAWHEPRQPAAALRLYRPSYRLDRPTVQSREPGKPVLEMQQLPTEIKR